MAKPTRVVGRESYWRLVLKRWERSGLSVPAFCEAEGVSAASLYAWRRKLDEIDDGKPAFLPVHVITDEPERRATRGIEVVLANGRCLRVGPGFDSHTLVRVVELLETGGISC